MEKNRPILALPLGELFCVFFLKKRLKIQFIGLSFCYTPVRTKKDPAALHELCRAAGLFYACGKGSVALQPTVRLEAVSRWVRTASASSPPMASSSSTERVVEQRMVWKVMVSMPSARS